MKKILWTLQGYVSCLGWMIPACLRWVYEECPDLKFWEWHDNMNDHLWYAERVNGRVAMLVLSVLLILELIQRKSIWEIVYGM
jgi:hypothetical protein